MVGQKPGAKRAVSLLNFGKQDVEEPATRSWQSGKLSFQCLGRVNLCMESAWYEDVTMQGWS